MDTEQQRKMGSGQGFLAALDQSGGSTPKALAAYGVAEDQYSGDEQMFDKVHEMRTRIMTSPAFTGDRVLAAILFEDTMRRQVEGRGTGEYLWSEKQVVPIIKIDKGLADESDGVQLMKPMPGLDALLRDGVAHGMFGTKERSFIKQADPAGVKAIVDQQFEIGRQVSDAGLVPILEPEVDITSTEKAKAEALLKDAILEHLGRWDGPTPVMLKLSLPDEPDFYADLIGHEKVLRVVALSGGYSRDEANEILARNHGLIASFSRALAEGLHADQSDADFDATLETSVEGIYRASLT